MNKSTEEIFKKLSDKITLIYDLEFAKSLVSRMKDKSKRHWRLVKLAASERERDEERRARAWIISRKISTRNVVRERKRKTMWSGS